MKAALPRAILHLGVFFPAVFITNSNSARRHCDLVSNHHLGCGALLTCRGDGLRGGAKGKQVLNWGRAQPKLMQPLLNVNTQHWNQSHSAALSPPMFETAVGQTEVASHGPDSALVRKTSATSKSLRICSDGRLLSCETLLLFAPDGLDDCD